MNINTFNACAEGYGDRLFDLQLLTVHVGYWSGYYHGAKRPKPLHTILRKLVSGKNHTHADSVDVETFKQMEERFKGIIDGK